MKGSKSVNDIYKRYSYPKIVLLIFFPMNVNISKTDQENSFNLMMVDIGDISKMIGYTFKIIDYLGKVVHESLISQQVFDLDLNALGGKGTYFLQVIDDTSQILEIKKIVLR